MKLTCSARPSENLLPIVIGGISLTNEKLCCCLCTNGEEIPNHYKPLTNVAFKQINNGVRLYSDNITFTCMGDTIYPDEFKIKVDSLPDSPVIASGILDVQMLDGDRLALNFMNGIFDLVMQ